MTALQNINYSYKIEGQKIKSAREHLRIPVEQLARAVCLSVKNIKEIEDTNTSFSFYSFPIKVSAAKRVGKYLGLEQSEYLEELNDAKQ